jgi:hypothetical protein
MATKDRGIPRSGTARWQSILVYQKVEENQDVDRILDIKASKKGQKFFKQIITLCCRKSD